MKKAFTTVVLLVLFLNYALAQNIPGSIKDRSGQLLAGATITVLSGNTIIIEKVSKDGTFSLPLLENAHVSFTYTGKATRTLTLSKTISQLEIVLDDEVLMLEPLEVKATRAGEKAPFTKTDLSKLQVQKQNVGQDIPFFLNQTPSVVANSDAGTGIGYTGMTIRGTDASRINITLNGIPWNDAESQGTFFVNLPDFSSSVNSMQIQRGVGTSTNGAGAFGATVNISTHEVNKSAYAELNNSYGSFNTWKNTARVGSGLIDNKFTFDARLSRITSDGFIDRAWSKLQSFYLSGAYLGKNNSVRFNIFSGSEKTYQAWNGVPEAILKTNRTFNSSGTEKPGEPYNNEIDDYRQTHYQLFWNGKINSRLSFNVATFLTRGIGFYENYRAEESYSDYGLPDFELNGNVLTETDIVRQLWLDNHFYGGIYSLQYTSGNHEVTFGGGITQYDGKHYGKIPWAQAGIPKDHSWYNLPSFKKDFNNYLKWQYSFSPTLALFTDLQLRFVSHDMRGFRDNPTLPIHRKFTFLNPKAGISYTKGTSKAYLSYAMANKEPNRNDFEAGVKTQPSHETLHDVELGYERRFNKAFVAVTAYYMYYRNQLILTGQINDVGAYTRTNVPESYRAGIELQGALSFAKWISASANLTLSKNKVKSFTEFIDDYDAGNQKATPHKNTDIALSPSIIAATSINISPVSNMEITLSNKYVGKQYLDNTMNESRMLDPFFVQDARIGYKLQNWLGREINFAFQVNNIFNRRYEPNGYTFSYIYGGETTTENFYFPMAGTNYMATINVRF